MRKTAICLLMMLASAALGAQKVVQKTDLLYWATSTPNVGLEVAMGRKLSAELYGGYNPWDYPSDMSLRHWSARAGLRYWLWCPFQGHFFGADAIYAEFDVGKIPFIRAMEDYRFDGHLWGGGISYGYHFPLGKRWGIEVTAGVGYVSVEYDKYSCDECAEIQGRYKHNYFGPTKLSVSLVFILR